MTWHGGTLKPCFTDKENIKKRVSLSYRKAHQYPKKLGFRPRSHSNFPRGAGNFLSRLISSATLWANLSFELFSLTRRGASKVELVRRSFRLVFDRQKMAENVMREDNCERSDSTLVAKSSGSLIESRSIELVSADDKQGTGKCGHFSIRGYVAEIRRKDRNICWPFSSVGNRNELEEPTGVLPPLHATEFKWWGCQNCLRKTNARGAPTETGVAVNCCNTGFKTNVTCSRGITFMPPNGDAQNLLSGFQEASEENINDRRKAITDISIHMNDEYCPSLSGDKKENGAEVMHPITEDVYTSTGLDGLPGKNKNLSIFRPTCSAMKVYPCLTGGKVTKGGTFRTSFETDKHGRNIPSNKIAIASQSVSHYHKTLETVILKLKGDELIESGRTKCGSRKNTDIWLDIRKMKCQNSSKDIFHKEDPGFSSVDLVKMNGQRREVMTYCGISDVDVGSHKNEALNAVMNQTGKLNSLVLKDSKYGFSENNEKLVGNNAQDPRTSQCGNSCETLHRSKTRKVRLLADIIRSEVLAASNETCGLERDANTDLIKTKGAHSKETPEASSEINVHLGANSQVAVQRTDTKIILGKTKKRKMPRDQNEGSFKMTRPRGELENFGIIKGDVEIKNIDIGISNSQVAADASIRIDLYPGSKSYLGKNTNDKKVILGKEKKVSRVEDKWSFLTPWQEGISKEAEIRKFVESKCTGVETGPFKSAEDAFTGNDPSPGLRSYGAAQNNENKNSLGRKKNKVLHFEDGKSSLMPWQENILQKDQIIKRYVDKKHKGAASVSLNSAQDPFSGRGVHHGLKHQKETSRKAIVSKKRNKIPRVECTGNMPEFEGGGSSLMCQQKDSSDTCNYENTTDVKGPSKLSLNQYDQRADKMCEQAALDDIPMEIVELMARNQYERRLFYANENRYCVSETTKNAKRADLADSTETLGNEMLRLRHKKKSHMPKPHSSNASGMCIGKSVGYTKEKSDGYHSHVDGQYNSIHFNISQLEQVQASTGFTAFPKSQEMLSTNVRFPGTDSRRHCSTQNCSWNGDMMGSTCFGTSVQSLEEHYPCQSILRQSSFMEVQQVWSSMVPNRTSFGIKSPQNFVTESSNVNKLYQCPDPLPKGNVSRDPGLKPMNLNATHLQKKEGSSDMETIGRTHPEYPFASTDIGNEYHPKIMGPLDLYTNETISAMNLLRLMDAGLRSSTHENVDDNPDRFPKAPPFSHDHLTKELSGSEDGVPKIIGASVKPPSCDHLDNNHHLQKSCKHFTPVPMVNAVDSSIHKDGNFKRASGFTDGFLEKTLVRPLKYQEREKTKRSYSPTQSTGLMRSHRSASRAGSSSKNHEYVIIHDLQKGFLSASDSRQFTEQSQTMDYSTKHVELEVNKKDGTVSSVGRICGTEICTVNRNPADFTVPEAGNVYMIGGGDLKYRKMKSSRDRSGLINMDGHKRQRIMKLTAIQEHDDPKFSRQLYKKL